MAALGWLLNLGFAGGAAAVVWTVQDDASTTWSDQTDDATAWADQTNAATTWTDIAAESDS